MCHAWMVSDTQSISASCFQYHYYQHVARCQNMSVFKKKSEQFWGLPDSPVVRALHFQCRGCGSVSGWGTGILPAKGCPPHQKKKKPKKNSEQYSLKISYRGLISRLILVEKATIK